VYDNIYDDDKRTTGLIHDFSTKMYHQRHYDAQSTDDEESQKRPPSLYKVWLSLRFILVTLACVVTISFLVGRFCRSIILVKRMPQLVTNNGEPLSLSASISDKNILPPSPVLPPGRQMPNFVYTSRTFADGSARTSDSFLVTKDPTTTKEEAESNAEYDDGDREHFPEGQHLLVDIKNVDGSFLNSEKRLGQAVVDLIQQSGLTLLSYHCHQLIPLGVSCVGVLLESHVSLHTWPISGVITLDLFTCGPVSLLPTLPVIQELFAIPRVAHPSTTAGEKVVEQPYVKWSHKLRGFRSRDAASHPSSLIRDVGTVLLGSMEYEMKKVVVSTNTDYQTVDIYDMSTERRQYGSQTLNNFSPERFVYLNGILQYRSVGGQVAYHETLVHPAMLSHENPQQVAIIGGSSGATLREVFKHNTVHKVTMIEMDEQLVQLSRKFLPKWNDGCSGIITDRAGSGCFDDPKVEWIHHNAVAWFQERYLSNASAQHSRNKYDVIFMDVL